MLSIETMTALGRERPLVAGPDAQIDILGNCGIERPVRAQNQPFTWGFHSAAGTDPLHLLELTKEVLWQLRQNQKFENLREPI